MITMAKKEHNFSFLLFYFFSFIYAAGVEPSPFFGLLYLLWMLEGDDCGAISGMNEWQGKQKYSEKTCLSAALCTTDPT
jgi:hypothetical protein